MKTADELTDALPGPRACGSRPQRQAIFRLLHGNDAPPDGRLALRRGPRRDADDLAEDRVPDRARSRGARRGARCSTSAPAASASTRTSRPSTTTSSAAVCGRVRDVPLEPTCPRLPAPRTAATSRVDAVAGDLPRACATTCASAADPPSHHSPVQPEATRSDHARPQGKQDPRQPQGSVRRREPGEPPLPLLRAEGRRRGLPRRRRAVPLGRRG